MKKPTNKGFEALPKKVQDIILKRMEMGGGLDRADDYGTKKNPYPSVSSSDFAGGHRSYPIPTKADAIDALRLAGLHGRSDVKAKVYAKYPSLKKQFGGENVPVGYHMMPDGTIMSDEEMMYEENSPLMENIMLYAKGGEKGKIDRNLFDALLNASPTGDKYVTTVQPGSTKYQEANINASMQNFGHKKVGLDSEGFPIYRSSAGDTFIRHNNKLDYVNVGDVSKVAGNVGLKAIPPAAIPPSSSFGAVPNAQLPTQFNPNQNYNPNTNTYTDPMTGKPINPIIEQYKMGGGNLYKFVGDGYKKLGGPHAPQGESMDEFLTNKNTDFVNYIANNTKAALFKNDAMDLQKGFAQMGQEVEGEPKVILDNPNNPLQPRGPQYPDFMQGPNGMYAQGNQNPQYVTDFTKQFNFPEVQSNTGTPSNLNLNPYGDVMNNSKPSYNFTTEDASDLTMFGIQGANNFFNRANEMEQEKQLKKKRTIENVVTPFYGSRGNYDINQGNFRPNDKTPISYKKGGQYQLNKEDISILLSQGYLLEFVD